MTRLFSCKQNTTNRQTSLIDKNAANIDWLNARAWHPVPFII